MVTKPPFNIAKQIQQLKSRDMLFEEADALAPVLYHNEPSASNYFHS
ncbi:MAG: hypothetical protein GDA51_12210 [Ekhidna sp.]|nr:hypothetical protein [Ekhidna sp.]